MRRMYSENQLEKLIQEAVKNGNIKLYEEIDIASTLTPVNPSGIETTLGYCKIRKTDDDNLIVVLNFSLKNTSESSISLGNTYYIEWNVPSDIASKIYDISGTPVSSNPEGYPTKGIASAQVYSDSGTISAGFYNGYVMTFLNITGANKASFQIRGYSSIASNATHNFTFRIFLTL